jgi:hypothetical protein
MLPVGEHKIICIYNNGKSSGRAEASDRVQAGKRYVATPSFFSTGMENLTGIRFYLSERT